MCWNHDSSSRPTFSNIVKYINNIMNENNKQIEKESINQSNELLIRLKNISKEIIRPSQSSQQPSQSASSLSILQQTQQITKQNVSISIPFIDKKELNFNPTNESLYLHFQNVFILFLFVLYIIFLFSCYC